MKKAILTIENQNGRPTITKEMVIFVSQIAATIDEDTTVTIDGSDGQRYIITPEKEVQSHETIYCEKPARTRVLPGMFQRTM